MVKLLKGKRPLYIGQQYNNLPIKQLNHPTIYNLTPLNLPTPLPLPQYALRFNRKYQ